MRHPSNTPARRTNAPRPLSPAALVQAIDAVGEEYADLLTVCNAHLTLAQSVDARTLRKEYEQ